MSRLDTAAVRNLPDGPDLIAALKTGRNITTVFELLSVSANSIADPSRGLALEPLQRFMDALPQLFAPNMVRGDTLVDEYSRLSMVLPCGCEKIDALLRGGFYTGEITEVAGTSGAGKTQLCLQVAANVATTTSTTVAYLDSGMAFSGQRVKDLTPATDERECAGALSRVRRFRVPDCTALLEQLDSFYNALRGIHAEGRPCDDSQVHTTWPPSRCQSQSHCALLLGR